MAFLTLAVVLLVSLTGTVTGMIKYNADHALSACYNPSSSTNASLIEECSKAFKIVIEETGKRLNFTEDQIKYVLSLEREMQGLFHKHRRVRRQAGRAFPVPIRRECRLLHPVERFHLFSAIRTLKESIMGTPPRSEYDTLADLHRGMAVDAHAHRGSNFLGWHRVYLVFYELALRRKRFGVTMCFWDTTMEFRLGRNRWVETAVFSSQFFGNRAGQVVTGPFAYWRMPEGLQEFGPLLTRELGAGGMPVDSRAAASIFYSPNTLTHTQVTFGGSGFETVTNMDGITRDITIEGEHNNVHVWVGRAMRFTDSATQDPVFFFHHCYIDYMWEKFRDKMKFHGRVPSADYPGHGDPTHEAGYQMIGFPGYRNIDGYSDYFTSFLYRYHGPTCFACHQSPYTTCDGSGQCAARTIIPGTELVEGPWAEGSQPGSARMAAFEAPAFAAFGSGADTGASIQTSMGRSFTESSRSE